MTAIGHNDLFSLARCDQPQATEAIDTTLNAEISQKCPAGSDPVGLWYIARAQRGISDNNWFGIVTRDERDNETLQWHTVAHRHADGIGALTQLLQRRGYSAGRTPVGRDRVAPSLREALRHWQQARHQQELATHVDIRWRLLDASRAKHPHNAPPQTVFFSSAEYTALRHAANHAGASATNWLAWSLDRALRRTLVEPDSPLRWVFPVNLRGAVQAAAPHMNHCGGLALVMQEHTVAADIATQLRARFALSEHWRNWWLLNLGRVIGQRGVNLAWALTREAPGSWAGSYSNLGAWPLQGMTLPDCAVAQRGAAVTGAICASPGSPAYPVSTGIVEWQGRLALACRVHPVADEDGQAAARLLAAWRAIACGD